MRYERLFKFGFTPLGFFSRIMISVLGAVFSSDCVILACKNGIILTIPKDDGSGYESKILMTYERNLEDGTSSLSVVIFSKNPILDNKHVLVIVTEAIRDCYDENATSVVYSIVLPAYITGGSISIISETDLQKVFVQGKKHAITTEGYLICLEDVAPEILLNINIITSEIYYQVLASYID